MTAEELIAQIKSECQHNIGILEKRIDRMIEGPYEEYHHGYAEGQLRWDKDMLEKIEEWENQNKMGIKSNG